MQESAKGNEVAKGDVVEVGIWVRSTVQHERSEEVSKES